jgi:xylan 1,4-beta-xylosidase
VLGRETAIQRVDWDEDGLPRIDGGVPAEVVPGPAAVAVTGEGPVAVDDFDGPALGPDWSTLRRPATPDWVDLTARPSHLRIHGGQSPIGRHRPSLVAQRVTARRCELETAMEFRPRTFRQLAGVTAYYNTRNWHHAYVTVDDDGRRVLEVMSSDNGQRTRHAAGRIDATSDRVRLRVRFDGLVVRFAYSFGDDWHELPLDLDATILSDEYATTAIEGAPETFGFTGAFVGLWVQDLGADGGFADFDSATYRVLSDAEGVGETGATQ